MKGYLALMLWIAMFFWMSLAILNLKNDLNFTKEELKQIKIVLSKERSSSAYYKQRFVNCKTQLGVFYREPCLDNSELDFCE